MRLQLTVQRHSIPPVKVLWTVESTRPTANATGASFTISQFLEQVNEVIPLEADDWGLEDYAVEVRGYECLHFSELNQVLKEDDEVCIRPLQTSDLRFRRISGRHQITADGRHLIDGVAFGRPFLRRAERPFIRIPPRKRRRVTYDAEDDDDSGELFNDSQIMAPPGYDDDIPNVNSWADDDDDEEDDDDYIEDDNEEQGLAAELQDVNSDLGKMATKEGDGNSEAINGSEASATTKGNSRRVTRSQRLTEGLGLQGPALLELVDENGRPFPGVYNNPLLELFSQPDASIAEESPRRKRRKTNGIIESNEDTTPKSLPSSGALVRQRRRDSSASLKSVRFQDGSLATPPTTVLAPLDESEDTEDEDFELPADEDEVGESDKENAEPRFEEFSSDNMSSESETTSSESSGGDSDSDDTSSSSESTSCSSSGSDTELHESSDSSSGLQADEETSSSGSSSDSSDSESEDGGRPSNTEASVHPSKTAKSKGSIAKPSRKVQEEQAPHSRAKEKRTIQKEQDGKGDNTAKAGPPQQHAPPGQGKHSTHYRNKRRRLNKMFHHMKESGEYADDEAIRSAIASRIAEPSTAKTTETTKTIEASKGAADAEFEARRKALLESIASGGVDVGTPEAQSNNAQDQELAQPLINDQPREPATMGASQTQTGKVPEPPSNAQQAVTVTTAEDVLVAERPPGPSTEQRTESAAVTMGREIEENAAQSKPTSTEHSAEPPSAKASKPRAKVDLASSRRMLFGALGLRTPKTREEEKALQSKLMENVRPIEKMPVQTQDSVQQGTSRVSVNDDDDSWRDKINLRAVECCHEGIQLSTPPFPFVQRWDPQQQRGYSNTGKGKKGDRNNKKRKRNNQRYYDPLGMEEQWTEPPAEHEKISPHAPVDENVLQQIEAPESSSAQKYEATIDEQTMWESYDAIADTAGHFEEDLPDLPEDLASCETLTKELSSPGTVVAFKMLDMSGETNWQPRISEYRTALINESQDDGPIRILQMTLAHRDRSNQQVFHHPKTGKRLYNKFEMPGYDSQEEDGDSGHLELPFDELIDPKVIQASKPKQAQQQDQAVETSTGEAVAAEPVNGDMTIRETADNDDTAQNSQVIEEDADKSWEGIEDTAVVEDAEMITDLADLAQDNGSDRVKYPDLPKDTEAVEIMDTEEGLEGEPAPRQLDGANRASEQSTQQRTRNVNDEVREEIFSLIREAGWRSSLNPEVRREQVIQAEVSPTKEKLGEEVHVPSSPPMSAQFNGLDDGSRTNAEDDDEELADEIPETHQEPAEVPDSNPDPTVELSSPRNEAFPNHDGADEWALAAVDDEDSALWDTQANQQIASEGISSQAPTPKASKANTKAYQNNGRIAKSISPPRLSRSKASPRISSTAPEPKRNANRLKTDGKVYSKPQDDAFSSDEFPSLEKVFAARIASLDHPSSSVQPPNINVDRNRPTTANTDEEIKSEDSIFDISALPSHTPSTQTPSTQNTQKQHTQKRSFRSTATPMDDSSLQYISDDASGFVFGSQIPEGSQIIDLTLSSDPVEPSDSAYEGDSSLPTGPGWMEKVRRGGRERTVGRGPKKANGIVAR